MNRILQSLLLIAVMGGNLLVSVHVATHLPAGAIECELCVAYNDLSAALPGGDLSTPVINQPERQPASVSFDFPHSSIYCTRPRGPPTLV